MAPAYDSIATRQSLLSRLRDLDDRASWQDFYDTYSNLIVRTALQAGLTQSEADDVLQETLIYLAKKLPGFKYDPALGSFKRWLLQATEWRILDQFRRRKRANLIAEPPQPDGTRTSADDRIPDPQGLHLEAIWDAEWDKTLFDAALNQIKKQVKPRHFQIFELYVVRQWPVRKVVQALGVNMGQVYLAKHRVSGLLKKEINRLEKELV